MKRVLVVDDEQDQREAVRSLLEVHGYGVTEARNGAEARRLFEAQPFDVVVTDIVMPEVEGTEMIRQLRRIRPDAKIIALSGSDYAERGAYLRIAKSLGAQKTFLKPVDSEDLLEAVRELAG